MSKLIDQEPFITLEKFYKKLYDNILRSEKKLESGSALLTMIKIKANKASKLLNESSIKSIAFSLSVLKNLEKNGFIRSPDDKNKLDEYVLTAQGIWEVEIARNGFDVKTILGFFQKNFFTFSETNRPLNDKEKVILLSMLGTRMFSIESLMDLNKHNVKDHWLAIFKESYEFLVRCSIIESKLTFEKQGNEHPVSYMMRRANYLPQKTQHIFYFANNSQYYLDLINDGEISISKLKNIFRLIFGKIEESSLIDDVQQFCNHIAYDKSKYVKEDFKFIESKYDEVIKNSLKQLYLD